MGNHFPKLNGLLHRFMDEYELNHHFGTADMDKVEDYYVIMVKEKITVADDDEDQPKQQRHPRTRKVLIDVPAAGDK
jgi:hypothetical protein